VASGNSSPLSYNDLPTLAAEGALGSKDLPGNPSFSKFLSQLTYKMLRQFLILGSITSSS